MRNMLVASSRKQSTLPKAEVMMLLLVIRTGHRFSSSHFLATKQKQSWAEHSDTPWQSLIKSVQSPEHKLPFCGHRCLLDHCGTKREMNVKLSVMPLASIYCFGVQMSWHQCQLICTSLMSLKIHSAYVDLSTPNVSPCIAVATC